MSSRAHGRMQDMSVKTLFRVDEYKIATVHDLSGVVVGGEHSG